jgi:hypothetical protein
MNKIKMTNGLTSFANCNMSQREEEQKQKQKQRDVLVLLATVETTQANYGLNYLYT